jgi:peroxiredoxin
LADYRAQYPEIRSAGASVVAVSVDAANKSETLRLHLSLPFPILCDTERRVVLNWGIFNAGERGGIAKPAVFIIDPGRVVRFAAVDGVVRRVPAARIVSVLHDTANVKPVRRRVHVPRLSDWIGAIRNSFRR